MLLVSHQRIIKGIGGLGGRRTSGDYPKYNIIENGQNTEKSPGDLRRLEKICVTQADVKHQLSKSIQKTFELLKHSAECLFNS